MNGKIKQCDCCGNEFVARGSTKYCSDDCRKFIHDGTRTKKKEKKPIVSLAEMERRAREMGMTYGQYMIHIERG